MSTRLADDVYLNQLGIACALGCSEDDVAASLFADDMPRGVAMSSLLDPRQPTSLGTVAAELPALDELPVELRGRNNALLSAATIRGLALCAWLIRTISRW